MPTELTDKTHAVVMTDRNKFFITENEAKSLSKLIGTDTKIIGLKDGTIINLNYVMYISHSGNIVWAEKQRQGFRKCPKCGQELLPGKTCGFCY